MEQQNSTNYHQVVEGSHRYTLYGLQRSLQYLREAISVAMPIDTTRISYSELQYALKILEHIEAGIQNSIDAGEELTKVI